MEKNNSIQNIETEDGKKEENLEDTFRSLEEVIRELEKGEVSLEESFDLYNQGMTLLRKCSSAIDEVEKKVLILDEGGDTHEF